MHAFGCLLIAGSRVNVQGGNRATKEQVVMGKHSLTWEQWKGAVNAAVIRKVGVPADDLPDWDYRDAFESGMAPSKAAAAIIRNAKES